MKLFIVYDKEGIEIGEVIAKTSKEALYIAYLSFFPRTAAFVKIKEK